VTNIESGASATGPNFRYRARSPVITGIQPASGDEDGGFQVTISGGGFESPVRVTFGTATAASASVQGGGTQVVTTAPAFSGTFPSEACDANDDGQQGQRYVPIAVDVTVTNQLTSCSDTLDDGFRYIPDDQSCRGDVAPSEPPTAAFLANSN